LATGWPDELAKKCPKCSQTRTYIVRICRQLFPWIKVDQRFWLLLQISRKCPKVINRPIGENSTNLVTLVGKQNELNKKISVSSVPSSAALMRFGSA
jgi:hypothetical protein